MFIEKLSEEFGLSCIKNNNESICSFPTSKGSGYIRSSIFSGGMEVIEINGMLDSPMDLPINTNKNFLLRMVFNMRWAASYIDSKGEKHGLSQFDSILSTQRKNEQCSYNCDTDQPISLFVIELDLDALRKRLINIDFQEEDSIVDFLDKIQKQNFFFSKTIFTLSLHEMILKLINTTLTGKMRYIYQEAKLTEIIVERFRQFMDDLDKGEISIQRKLSIQSIEKVAIIISTQLNDLPTIKELAKNSGLSQNLLQKGFKEIFGCSVNQYIADLRLNRAIELLETSDYNITEITRELGLNSKSYFSKIFKAKFGIGPKEYEKLLKSNKN